MTFRANRGSTLVPYHDRAFGHEADRFGRPATQIDRMEEHPVIETMDLEDEVSPRARDHPAGRIDINIIDDGGVTSQGTDQITVQGPLDQ